MQKWRFRRFGSLKGTLSPLWVKNGDFGFAEVLDEPYRHFVCKCGDFGFAENLEALSYSLASPSERRTAASKKSSRSNEVLSLAAGASAPLRSALL